MWGKPLAQGCNSRIRADRNAATAGRKGQRAIALTTRPQSPVEDMVVSCKLMWDPNFRQQFRSCFSGKFQTHDLAPQDVETMT